MGFSVSVHHPEVAQSQAQPTALQVGEDCTVVELAWLHCREQRESDPFQGGSDMSMGHCTHHWAPVSYWGAAPQLQRNSSSFLQSAPVAWIQGSGTQPCVWPSGNHKQKEPQGTSRA